MSSDGKNLPAFLVASWKITDIFLSQIQKQRLTSAVSMKRFSLFCKLAIIPWGEPPTQSSPNEQGSLNSKQCRDTRKSAIIIYLQIFSMEVHNSFSFANVGKRAHWVFVLLRQQAKSALRLILASTRRLSQRSGEPSCRENDNKCYHENCSNKKNSPSFVLKHVTNRFNRVQFNKPPLRLNFTFGFHREAEPPR